jgi:hypothetical protein
MDHECPSDVLPTPFEGVEFDSSPAGIIRDIDAILLVIS